jgi:Protein of unknown function (DUF3616)
MERRMMDCASRQHRGRIFARSIMLAALAGVGTLQPVAAETKLKPVAEWKVAGDFSKSKDARANLSGAACATTTPPFQSCVIVNDEKKYAQFFTISGTTLDPGKVIRLLDDDVKGDPDAEAAAYSDGYFYITGSHGRSRSSDDKNKTSYVVFRFAVDETTGKPTFKVSDDEVVGVDATTRLREVLENAESISKVGEPVSKHFDKPLSDDGDNIEGMAAKDGRLYFGLRGPSHDKHAYIVSVDADALFTENKSLKADIDSIELGKDAGIRDLAAVAGGLLILSGPVNDQDVKPAVFFLKKTREAFSKIGEIEFPSGLKEAKAETLLVLSDAAGEPWRALVMFDGPANGAPTEYQLPR